MKPIVIFIFFNLLFLMGCSQSARGPSVAEANEWVKQAKERDRCIYVFRAKVEASLGNVDLDRTESSLLSTLAHALPNEEKEILATAIKEAPIQQATDGHFIHADRSGLVKAIGMGFRLAGICNKEDPEYDMYAFADGVSSFLIAHGFDAEELLRAQWDSDRHNDPLREILVVLALELRED